MLSNFLRSRKMQKLLAELEQNPQPAPEVFVELVRMYREDGDYQTASRVPKRGAELYPDSERILQSRADMERVTRDLEKERFRQKIDSYPNPILFSKLAQLYKQDNEIEASIRVCQAGISMFPSYGGNYLVLGEICMESGDLAGARVHLEKAAELDKYNYEALRLLASVYMQLEMPDEAARRLEQILYFAPGDENVLAMLAKAREAAGTPEPTPPAADTQQDYIETEEPPQIVVDDSPAKAAKAGSRETEINDSIGLITGLRGVKGALLVDPYGLVIAADLSEDVDEELAGAMITNIFKSVARASEPMGIGVFENGLIEGDGGNIHVWGIEDMILAVFADPQVKMGLLEKTLRDFAEKVLD